MEEDPKTTPSIMKPVLDGSNTYNVGMHRDQRAMLKIDTEVIAVRNSKGRSTPDKREDFDEVSYSIPFEESRKMRHYTEFASDHPRRNATHESTNHMKAK